MQLEVKKFNKKNKRKKTLVESLMKRMDHNDDRISRPEDKGRE